MKPHISGMAMILLLCALLATLATATGCMTAHAAGQPPYVFAVDQLMGSTAHNGSDSRIRILRDISIPAGESLSVRGWVATDEGIAGYRYMWVPTGGGVGSWQDVKNPEIGARKDLGNAGVPYASGHGTAGFGIAVEPPADLPAGYYDIYIRAIDGMGQPCDLLALLHTRYGDTDLDNGQKCTVSFDRLDGEGKDILRGGAAVTSGGITLPRDGRIRLGEYNLAGFDAVQITYSVEGYAEGDKLLLGLKSAGDRGYGAPSAADGKYNMTDSLAHAVLTAPSGTVSLPLEEVLHSGAVWLATYGERTVTVSEVTLVYGGYATDRVSAKLHLSGESAGGYFSGANRVEAKGVTDPVLGDVLRIEVTEDTNDPYIHFNAEGLLRTADIRLSADDYRYMVVLARAMPKNPRPHMTFYLCAGTITGATEACTYTVELATDGLWHYYLIDLTDKDTWSGLIHGWRFDIINGDSVVGNAVEFATVQFFRTPEAAQAAASRRIDASLAWHTGEPAVERDMSEEAAVGSATVDPADTYIETHPETEPPTAPIETVSPTDPETGIETEPPCGTALESPAASVAPDETDPPAPGTGCASLLGGLSILLLATVGAASALRRCKRDI